MSEASKGGAGQAGKQQQPQQQIMIRYVGSQKTRSKIERALLVHQIGGQGFGPSQRALLIFLTLFPVRI